MREWLRKSRFTYCAEAFLQYSIRDCRNESRRKKMIATAEKFGFHQPLQIPLDVRPSRFPNTADPVALAMDSFGQRDIQVSPLQMAMVAAAVANDGKLMKPYLIDQVLSADLEVLKENSPEEFSTPLSQENAQILQSIMGDVMKSNRMSRTASGIEVAGKTGTAEISANIDPHAWFIGFDSGENPKVAVAVFLENGGWGFREAAPIGMAVINAAGSK
ncbi:penicillin-binding transpeptidase domain-containing protein [Arcanobacterium hippocoleae]